MGKAADNTTASSRSTPSPRAISFFEILDEDGHAILVGHHGLRACNGRALSGVGVDVAGIEAM